MDTFRLLIFLNSFIKRLVDENGQERSVKISKEKIYAF